jgi:hypothetical protein
MIEPQINAICKLVHEWCQDQNVQFDIVCDESDIQGVMIFKSKRLQDLLNHIEPAVKRSEVHLETTKVRGGTVVTFSLTALSEQTINKIIDNYGMEVITMTFDNKLDNAFGISESESDLDHGDKTNFSMNPVDSVDSGCQDDTREPQGDYCFRCGKEGGEYKPKMIAGQLFLGYCAFCDDFDDDDPRDFGVYGPEPPTAENDYDTPLGEGQYKTATSGMVRGQKRDEYLTFNQSTKGATKGASKGSKPRREVSGPKAAAHESFDSMLRSALLEQEDPSPDQLFKQFARALRVLGTKMGIGPIQDKLKQQGINWKQSADGRDIILTIRNATTNTDQPIARITYETLTNPADFENQLKSMLDFAMGDAPGASAQQEREIADRKKTVSDIAKAVQPTDQESEVAQQMNTGLQPEMQAAETAAMPK